MLSVFALLFSPCLAAAELCKNDFFGFSIRPPDGWVSEKIYWQGRKDVGMEGGVPDVVSSGLPPKLTEWSGKEIGCKFSGPQGAIFVRATTAVAAGQIPFQEYNGEFDNPVPAASFERLVSSEVFVSTYGARGVLALRGPAGAGTAPARAYYFPLLEGRKLWDMRMLSVILFVQPAPGLEAAARSVLDGTAATFAFYGGAGSEFDEDDDGKLFQAALGSVYYLRLSADDGRRWRLYESDTSKMRVTDSPAPAEDFFSWELTPLAPGRSEVLFRLYDKKQEAVKQFSLRFKVKQ